MNKQEQDNLEIEFLTKQLELDKFNYNRSITNLIEKITPLIAILIGLIPITIFLYEKSIFFFWLTIELLGFIIMILWSIYIDYEGQIKGHKMRFMIRNEMIKRRYLQLDMKKFKEEYKNIEKGYWEGKIKLAC